jgi:ABC-type amino acid transport substrate-binding protein
VQVVGWDFATNEICKRLKYFREFKHASWDGMILAVFKGEYAMAADGITIKPDRVELVDFSQDFLSLKHALLVWEGENCYGSSEEGLAVKQNLRIIVQAGTTN